MNTTTTTTIQKPTQNNQTNLWTQTVKKEDKCFIRDSVKRISKEIQTEQKNQDK